MGLGRGANHHYMSFNTAQQWSGRGGHGWTPNNHNMRGRGRIGNHHGHSGRGNHGNIIIIMEWGEVHISNQPIMIHTIIVTLLIHLMSMKVRMNPWMGNIMHIKYGHMVFNLVWLLVPHPFLVIHIIHLPTGIIDGS